MVIEKISSKDCTLLMSFGDGRLLVNHNGETKIACAEYFYNRIGAK
jgi:hypothetical protein